MTRSLAFGLRDICFSVLSLTFFIALQVQPATAGSSYRARVLEDSPIGYWGLDELSGTVASNLGTLGPAADGAYFGASIQGDAGTGFSDLGSAIRLGAGIGESGVNINAQLLSNRESFTISAWINPAMQETSSRAGLFGQNDAVEFGFIGPSQIQLWTPNGGSSELTYTLPNNQWHHIVATGDGSTGELLIYIDGVPLELDSTSGLSTANYGASDFGFNIGGGPIFGEDIQFVGAIDEVAVFDRALSPETIGDHYFSAFGLPSALQVNLGTGEAKIIGRDDAAIEINGYQITSAANSLRTQYFIALGAQGLNTIDHPSDPDLIPGSSPGESWEVIDASSGNIIEAFLFGSTTVDPSVALSLGRIVDTSSGRDTTLEFSYTTADGAFRLGAVTFIGRGGDYNDDGFVDNGDYDVWRQALGATGPFPTVGVNPDGNGDGVVDAADYTIWRDHLGQGVAMASPLVARVPEPTSFALCVITGLTFYRRRR